MREAARRTGCTHQAPYHYFPNREAILAALVTEGFEELANRLSAAHDGLEARGLTATLETSANAYIEFALRNPGVFRIMFRPDMCDPENFPEVRRAGERARGELTRLAQMVQGGGSTPEVEALFWAGVHGLASLLLDGPLAAELKTLGERTRTGADLSSRSTRLAMSRGIRGHRPSSPAKSPSSRRFLTVMR